MDQPFDEPGDSGLTDYERQRLELMRKNLDRMHDLQLPALAASLPPARATKATARGLPAAKKGWVRGRGESKPMFPAGAGYFAPQYPLRVLVLAPLGRVGRGREVAPWG